MGLDIYAGTLTRYYSRNWKNNVQQIAEANGQKCTMLDGSGNEIKPVEDKEEILQIHEAVSQWISGLAADLDSVNPSQSHQMWDDNNEGEYFTDKPDWEAYGALLLLLACHIQNHPLPEYVENDWSAFCNPIVKECMSQDPSISLLSNVVIWLPIAEEAIFRATLPTGNEARISTLALLRQELEEINQAIWKADEQTILSWRNDKYYIPIKPQKSKSLFGILASKNRGDKFRTEELAQCAFSILYQAVDFAIEHRVPLLLDY